MNSKSLRYLLCAGMVAMSIASFATPLFAQQDTRSMEAKLQAPNNLRLPPANAIRTASGLRYIILKRGTRTDHPTPTSKIVIDYTGWDFQGQVFDSSLKRGEPTQFQLNTLIKGWQEGVLLMSPGDTFRFWIPGALAYDSSPSQQSPKGKLLFDITLHSFEASK